MNRREFLRRSVYLGCALGLPGLSLDSAAASHTEPECCRIAEFDLDAWAREAARLMAKQIDEEMLASLCAEAA